MSGLYPAMHRLEGRRCVIVGGGKVGARKVAPLLDAGAEVLVIAPTFETVLVQQAAEGLLRLEHRPYRRGDLQGATLAFAATDSRTVNAAVADDATELGIPVNVADDPAASTFYVPAAFRQGGVTIAISTGGRSPAFARRLRQEIDQLLTPERLALLELYVELRMSLAEEGRATAAGSWDQVDEEALQLLRKGKRVEARQLLRQRVLSGDGKRR